MSSMLLSGQEKDMKNAVKKGKERGKDIYYAYPSSLTVEKYSQWEKSQNAYKIFGTKTDSRLIFGAYTPCISEISFL
jgi:hypothetical protein